jgi:hypothetical protein
MISKTLEQRAQSLENLYRKQMALNKKRQVKIDRLKARGEVFNVIGKFEHNCEAGRWEDVFNTWAKEQPDIRSEIANWGVYEGRQAIRNLYVGIHHLDTEGKPGSNYRPGFCEVDIGTSHIVEVAGDGKTARMWYVSPGVVPIGWHWWKLMVDFVKEGEKWKLYHYHVFGLFAAEYKTSWAAGKRPFLLDVAPLERGKHPDISPELSPPPLPEEFNPTRPTSHPVWWYRQEAVFDPVPVPPEPFEQWDSTMASVP